MPAILAVGTAVAGAVSAFKGSGGSSGGGGGGGGGGATAALRQQLEDQETIAELESGAARNNAYLIAIAVLFLTAIIWLVARHFKGHLS